MFQDESVLNEFAAEARGHLKTIGDALARIEGPNPTPALLETIFHAIHAIKGGAGFMGLTQMSRLSHDVENLLVAIQSDGLCLDEEIAEKLAASVEVLEVMLVDPPASNDMDIAPLREDLAAILVVGGGEALREDLKALRIEDEYGRDTGFTVNRLSIKALPEAHRFLYVLRYDLVQLQREGVTPVALVRELLRSGEIVDSALSDPGDDLSISLPCTISFDVLFSTLLEPDFIALVAGLPEENIVRVDKDSLLSGAPASRAGSRLARTAEVPTCEEIGEQTERPLLVERRKVDRLSALVAELSAILPAAGAGSMDRTPENLERLVADLQHAAASLRLVPLTRTFRDVARKAHDAAREQGKRLELDVSGDCFETSAEVVEALADPLERVVLVMVAQCLETPAQREAAGKDATGRLSLGAWTEQDELVISIGDDGRGVDMDEDALGLADWPGSIEIIHRPGLGSQAKLRIGSGLARG